MTNRRDNVVMLPGHDREAERRGDETWAVRAAVWQFDELSRRLRQLSPQPVWSARQWMIASTPFRMRLTAASRRLGELTTSRPIYEQTDIQWFLELKDAFLAAERWIHDIDTCLRTLQDMATSSSDRARETEVFTSIMRGLLEAVGRIRNLLVQRFPGVGPTPLPDAGSAGVTDITSEPCLRVTGQLQEAEERLQVLARMCEERPSAMDRAALSDAEMAINAETAVSETFRLLNAKVYAECSPLRFDHDIWEAFREQRDEFVDFYRSALIALEIYREVLQAYFVLKRNPASLHPGELRLIREDKRIHIEERDACIRAFSDFQGKFSAMLVVLRSPALR